MQSVIDHLQSVPGGKITLLVGIGLLGLLTLQTLVVLYGTVRRVYFEREQQRLERERLRLEIQAARGRLQEVEQAKAGWNGYRKFQVVRKVSECDQVESIYLAPHDQRPLPRFKPGQYLTFQLQLPGEAKPVIRCYSLSDSPLHPDYYRVTIKKMPAPPDRPDIPPGKASCFFCDRVREGDILDVKAPGGHFFLDTTEETPVVLISGGVGVTPMLSMLNTIVESGSKREVWFFLGARNRTEHIQKERLEAVAAEHENVRLHVCYSRPTEGDAEGRDYQHKGHVTVDLIKELLPSSNYEFFICGPGPMMKSITDGLAAWGVPDKSVHFEAFGPATVKKAAPAAPAPGPETLAVEVQFSRSGKTCRWSPETGSLLELAEANGIRIDAGCRAGNCGTCLVAVKSGAVEYLTEAGAAAEEGSCLTCICRPKANLVLDA